MTLLDPDLELERLADSLLALPAGGLEQFLEGQPPDIVEIAERALANRLAVGWRSTPATLAHRLVPEGRFKLWPYVSLLGSRFADAFRGRDPHQVWNVPSQYGKTTIVGNWGPIWALDRNPRLRLMYISYDADKAVEESGNARDLIDEYSADLRFRLRADRRARGMWKTDEGGGLYAVGINGAITGFPADALLCDDLIKGWQEAHSAAIRKKVWEIYRSQGRMRVQSHRSPIIFANTRWHEDDPTGRLTNLEDEGARVDGFVLLRLPAIAEDADPLGRAPGEALEPDRFAAEEVNARRAVLGSYLWAALEQQRPAPEEGEEIKRAWWRLEDRMPIEADEWLSTWDTKLKEKESGDYVCGQIWARTGSSFWLMDLMRGRWNQPETANAVALMAIRWPQCARFLLEAAGNAPEVADALRQPHEAYEVSDEIAGKLAMTEPEREAVDELRRRGMPGLDLVPPKGDKIVRARAVAPYIEAGDCHLPAHASWLGGFLDETAAFPNGTHDDQVDPMSLALARLARGPSSLGSPSKPLPPASASVRRPTGFGGTRTPLPSPSRGLPRRDGNPR